MDKDAIKELIREEIMNNLEIVIDENVYPYAAKSYARFKLFYGDELVSVTKYIETSYQ